MFIVTGENCQNCKMLKYELYALDIDVEFRPATECMDICRKLNIRSIPALVIDDKVVIGNAEIIAEIKKQKGVVDA